MLRFVSVDAAGQPTVRYEREYSLKDHLGNLRLAYRLGHVRRDSASLEPDAATHARESQQFDSLSVSAPIAQNVGSGIAKSGSYVARLNAGGSAPQPLGPIRQLAVQKGDTVTVSAYGLYPTALRNNFWYSLASFLTGLFHPAPGAPVGPDPTRGRAGLPLLQVGVAAGLTYLPQLSGGVPRGYLRVLVFNADSALVSQQVQQLSSAALNNYERLRLRVLVPQDGYVSAFVGNESDVDVFFDDVTVELRQGVQVQETQYDPTGLEMAGLTGTTPGLKSLSQYKFNGKEFQTDLGLNWNHQDWRFFDTQLGRWHVTDPELENGQEAWTPYSFGFDNAVRFADANGRAPGDGFRSGVTSGFVGTFTGIRDAAVAAVQSPQAFASAVGNVMVAGSLIGLQVSAVQQTYAFGKAVVQGDTHALGQQVGNTLAQLTIAAVTEGAGKTLGAVRGGVQGTRAVESEAAAALTHTSPESATVRVRHYSNYAENGMKNIKEEGIKASGRGENVGAHVEIGPNFGSARTGHVETGAHRADGRWGYVEFDAARDAIKPTNVGPRSTGVIPLPPNGKLPIQNSNPTFNPIWFPKKQ